MHAFLAVAKLFVVSDTNGIYTVHIWHYEFIIKSEFARICNF